MRLPILDRLPVIGRVLNDVVDGTKVIGGGPVPTPAGVETKVVAATAATTVTGLVMALATPLLARLPAPVRWVAMAVLPALVTGLASYLAPHTTRAAAP